MFAETGALLGLTSWEAQRYRTEDLFVILDIRNALNCHLFENSVRVAQTNRVLRSTLVREARPFSTSENFALLLVYRCVFFTISRILSWRGTLLAQACGARCVKRLAPN